MNPRYSVELNNNLVAIKDNTTGKQRLFISGVLSVGHLITMKKQTNTPTMFI